MTPIQFIVICIYLLTFYMMQEICLRKKRFGENINDFYCQAAVLHMKLYALTIQLTIPSI